MDFAELDAADDSRQGQGRRRNTKPMNGFSSFDGRYGVLRMISVRSGLVKTPVVPTVQSVPLGVAVIPWRRLLEFGAFGLGTKFHCDPSQFSVKVNWALPWIGTMYWPAVQMSLFDNATMPMRT